MHYMDIPTPGGVLQMNCARELQVVGDNPGLMTDPGWTGGRDIKMFGWILCFGMKS